MNSSSLLSRRKFIGTMGFIGGSLLLPGTASALIESLTSTIKIGLIADLHQDIMHDGKERLEVFLTEMKKHEADAIIQLGDFAYPSEKNKPLIDRFNQASRNPIHVIGNHDTDNGHTKEQCRDVWGIPNRYYVRDVSGLKVIVLDGNDKNSPDYKGGYPSYIGKEQLQWLKYQLNKLEGPIMLASHQPLAGPWCVDNADELQKLLTRYSEKVVLAVCGHTHIDEVYEVDGVNYLHINSASYQWVGGDHKHESYPKEVHEKYPWIEYTCPYRDPVFAMLTIDPDEGIIKVTGRESEWIGPDPDELGVELGEGVKNGKEVVPMIRDRRLEA